MATREFNGSSDYIVLGGTSYALAAGAFTVLAYLKPLALATGTLQAYVGPSRTTSNSALAEMGTGASVADSLVHTSYADGSVLAQPTNGVSEWELIAIAKPSGINVNVRMHCRQASGAYYHQDSTVQVGSAPTDLWTLTNIGRRGTGSNFGNFRIAAAAVYNSQLSDANFETIGNALSSQAVADFSPLALWEFNQASTATTVTDLIGSANETSKSGTTAASDNPGWTYGIAAGGGGTSAAQRMLLLGVG